MGRAIVFLSVDGADYSADVAVEAVRISVDDCDVAGVEDVRDVAGVPPADNAADDAVAVVDVAGVVGFLKRTGEASDYSADVASYVGVGRVAYRTGVVYVVYERAFRRVCRRRHVSDDAAHVQRLSGCVRGGARRAERTEVVGACDGALHHLSRDAADAGVALDAAGVVRVAYRCGGCVAAAEHVEQFFRRVRLVACTGRILSVVSHADFTSDAADVRRLGDGQDVILVVYSGGMYRAAVRRVLYLRAAPVEVADDAADVADDELGGASAVDLFFCKIAVVR